MMSSNKKIKFELDWTMVTLSYIYLILYGALAGILFGVCAHMSSAPKFQELNIIFHGIYAWFSTIILAGGAIIWYEKLFKPLSNSIIVYSEKDDERTHYYSRAEAKKVRKKGERIQYREGIGYYIVPKKQK